MSAKKGRGAKVLKVLQDKTQTASSLDDVDSPNLSAIEKASFLEVLQHDHGNPLHSTAVEEDLNVLEEGQVDKGKAGRKDIPPPAVKQRGAAVKRKETQRDGENEKKRSRSTGGKVKARPEKEGEAKKKKGAPQGQRRGLEVESDRPIPAASGLKPLVGKKPAKRRSARQTSAPAARPVKNQQMKKGKKRESEGESGSGESSDHQSSADEEEEESDTGTAQQRRRRVLSSDEEVVDEDKSWNPTPKKAKVYSSGTTRKSSSDKSKSRKSSSGSVSTESEKAKSDKRRTKRRGGQRGTELEVVLDAFLDFCDQYRESVESKAVKQTINYFTTNVKEQILEKITSQRELRVLKRENAKVGSLIRKKTQKLLDAKHELMRAERQAWLLQKEKAELELRLADLRQGQALLHDIRELNRQYLDYRHKHPKDKETYGASSLPALLLETKHIQAAEHQLRGINNRLEKRLEKNEPQK